MKCFLKSIVTFVAIFCMIGMAYQAEACKGGGTPPPPPNTGDELDTSIIMSSFPSIGGYSCPTPSGQGCDYMFGANSYGLAYSMKISQYGYGEKFHYFSSNQVGCEFKVRLKKDIAAIITITATTAPKWGCGTYCSTATASARWDGTTIVYPPNVGSTFTAYIPTYNFDRAYYCQ